MNDHLTDLVAAIQNFQDSNDKTAENGHILKPCKQDNALHRLQSWKPNSFIKAPVGFNFNQGVGGRFRES